jgi:hypothetical protein
MKYKQSLMSKVTTGPAIGVFVILVSAVIGFSQAAEKVESQTNAGSIRSSPAYA